MQNGRVIFKKISEAGFDAVVFFDQISQRYLTGFLSSDSVVLVTEQETALITDSRYFEAAFNAKSSGQLFEDVNPYLYKNRLFDALSEHIKAKNILSLAFDNSLLTVAQAERLKKSFPTLNICGITDICKEKRKIKSKREIENIKAAQNITDAAFSYILSYIKPDITEIEIAAKIEYFCRRNGAESMAFDTIAVSGKNSSLPHGLPSVNRLKMDSFFTMDFGAKYNGYCSDMTRTVVVGKATDEMKHIYQTVLTAQKLALDSIKSGVTGRYVDKVARYYINSAGYEGCFGHSTGHSLGLEIHEQPRFSTSSSEIISAGTVMTVEPGIYLPGKFGVRIEDLVLVTENGFENFTKSSKELIEI